MSTELPEFVYSCVEDWMLNLLAPTIERRLDATGAGALTWCPEWWRHAEAIARLEALWRAWEVCRDADGEAPSRWFWQHCDPMLAVLMDAKSGPLSNCKPDAHGKYDVTRSLTSTPAPQGHWGHDVATLAERPQPHRGQPPRPASPSVRRAPSFEGAWRRDLAAPTKNHHLR